MKLQLLPQYNSTKERNFFSGKYRATACIIYIEAFLFIIVFNFNVKAQGTWTQVAQPAPDLNAGVMLLLSDGTVMAKTRYATGDTTQLGAVWDQLTPDSLGSYVNGTWKQLAPMHHSRFYFPSQVLRDGRVFVAGGEVGTAISYGEIYDPLTDSWTMTPDAGVGMYDANSKMLPDGRVLVAVVQDGYSTIIFNPSTNKWSAAPTCLGTHVETAWLMLPDGSILFIDQGTKNSERYIPSLNQWVVDATVPDSLYDKIDLEFGSGILLPDGRAFFLGGSGHTAYYTPSGNASPGSWIAGPDIPDGMGVIDGPSSMMFNGKILFTASPVPKVLAFTEPTSFYEFNYLTNSYTRIHVLPGGGLDTLSEACYQTNFLNLPDGAVLYSVLYYNQYYIYSPTGIPLTAGKPSISSITKKTCSLYTITGKLFNGISEGSAYGDDWQMSTNYPIVRLKSGSGSNVYYARTFNWNSNGVQRGSKPDTAEFSVPANVPAGTYWLFLSANGISSDSVAFVYKPCATAIEEIELSDHNLNTYPNPANNQVTVSFKVNEGGEYIIKLVDIYGRTVLQEANTAIAGDNTHLIDLDGITKGIYMAIIQKGNTILKSKIVVN